MTRTKVLLLLTPTTLGPQNLLYGPRKKHHEMVALKMYLICLIVMSPHAFLMIHTFQSLPQSKCLAFTLPLVPACLLTLEEELHAQRLKASIQGHFKEYSALS